MIAGALVWNLLVSAAITFTAACLVLLAARLRVFARRPRLAVFILVLPFAKLAIELARGVPKDAFFWDKLGGAVQEQGTFIIGVGISRFGPIVRLAFGATHHGASHPQSAADGMATMIDRAAGMPLSAALGWLIGGVALVSLVREAVILVRASVACRRHAAMGTVVDTRRLWLRKVDVVVSSTWEGAPFAGGVLRPWICAPASLWQVLSAEEREAMVLHELGHLRWFDGALLAFSRMGRSLLWFVPGAGAAMRAVARQCELAADSDAVSRGIAPDTLASALVRAGEQAVLRPLPLLPFFRRERSAFVLRVQKLLRGDRPARLGVAPVALVVVLALTVLRMTAFGNP